MMLLARLACMLFAVLSTVVAEPHYHLRRSSAAGRLGTSLVQKAKKSRKMHKASALSMRRKDDDDDDDDGDGFEYGDRATHSRDMDDSDFSVHQFLVHDDGRDGSLDSDNSDLNVKEETERSAALAKQDTFDSEDTPDTSFVQKAKRSRKMHKRSRQAMRRKDDDDDDDDGDGFEYGDRATHSRDMDDSDFSVHQFLVHDDGRDGSLDSDNSDLNVKEETERSAALAKQDTFDSEDTPDTSFVQKAKRSRKMHKKSRHSLKRKDDDDDDDDGDGFEYGDRATHSRDMDDSDFSVHQFLVHDDGRDGSLDSDNSDLNVKEETERSAALAKQDTFDSEDTPDTSFVQTRRKSVLKV